MVVNAFTYAVVHTKISGMYKYDIVIEFEDDKLKCSSATFCMYRARLRCD